MSILSVEIHSRGASGEATSRTGNDVRTSYSITYRVQTDAYTTSPQDILDHFRTHNELPWCGRSWKFYGKTDSGVICTKVSPEYVEKSDGWWNVPCTFEPTEAGGGSEKDSQPSERDPKKTSENPEEWHREISVTSSPSSFPVEQAIFRGFTPPGINNPFLRVGALVPPVNSAIVPFDPPPEFDRSFSIIRLGMWSGQYNEQQMDPWRDLVNSEDYVFNLPNIYQFFCTIKALRGRIKHIGGTLNIINGFAVWKVETEIWIHPITWRDQLADRGTVRRAAFGDPDGNGGVVSSDTVANPGQPQHKQIVDGDDYPLTQPVLLNGNGQPMHIDGEHKGKPVWLNYQYYREGKYNGCPGW